MRRIEGVRPVRFLMMLVLGALLLPATAWAALPQVSNLKVQTTGPLTWDGLTGAAVYHVYKGNISGLGSGNYGGCLIGSVQGVSALPPADAIPAGTAIFFLVDAFDESGEGQLADSPGASPSPRCIPARRVFALTPDGDPGDGVLDGSAPLRNPSRLLWVSHEQTIAVALHTGEVYASALDLAFAGRSGNGLGNGAGNGLGNGFGNGTGNGSGNGTGNGLGNGAGNGSGNGIGNGGVVDMVAGWSSGGWGTHPPPVAMPIPPLVTCGGCHESRTGGGPVKLSQPIPELRFYESQIHYDGPLGHNWDFPANARLMSGGGNALLYFDGSGRQETFLRLDATHFAAPAGRYASMLQNANGSFTLRDRDGSQQTFHAMDGTNRSGTLESALDRKGDRFNLLYDNQGLLTKLVDPLGRSHSYAYDGAGRIQSITDFNGRQVVYSYDSNGNLASVRSPIVTGTPNGNDFPSGRTTTYTYSSGFTDERLNHNLIGVIRPNESGSGVPAVQIDYGSSGAAFDFDRVVSKTIGGTNGSGVAAGGTLTFSYQSLNPGVNPADPAVPRRKATVFDRNGNQQEYVHNINGNCLSKTDFTNRELRPGEPDYTTQYQYDSDGEVTQVGRPGGGWFEWRFDKPGADRYREGNLILVRSIADPLSAGGRGDGHGAESQDRIWTFTYEPVFNHVASWTEPRGNDPTYVPQNGGANFPGRYARTRTYDYQEGDPLANGIGVYASRFGISLVGAVFGLGDVNGDGSVLQAAGNEVKIGDPGIHLDPGSMQAAIAGGPLQIIETKIVWNNHGQPTAITDAEGNRHEFQYWPETDPDGDGLQTPTPEDGRVLDPATGGFLKTRLIDTALAPGRDNGVNPGPVQIQNDMTYDPAGNLATLIDGRGVATRFIHNALNELVEVRQAAATSDASGPDGTPATGRGETGLTPFGFLERYAYDADGNVLTAQREDRGATRGLGPFAEIRFTYDILDDVVQTEQPATSSLTLTSRYLYDANQNLTRSTEPDGNSHNRAFDERDLLLSSTRGAAGPLGGSPATRRYDYDAGGLLARLTDGRGGLTDYLYDGHDRLARTVDQVGGTMDNFYDPSGDVVRTLARGTSGGAMPTDRSGTSNVDLTDLRGLYDELARRIRLDAMLFVPQGPPPARPPMLSEGSLLPGDGAVNTIFEYDRLSRPTFLHKDSGAVTRIDYNGAGFAIMKANAANDTMEMTYDAAGNGVESLVTESSTQPGPVQEQFLTTFFYDALGRGTMAVNNLGETTRAVYDSLDAVVVASDANGPSGGSINRRSTGHPALSIPINAHGNVTRYTYDGADRPLTTVQVLTPTGKGDGTTFPAPDTSNPVNTDGLITQTTVWTGDGLPGQWLDDKGNTTSYAYDNLGRLIRTTRADGTMEQVTYDGEDNPVVRIDPNGTRVTSAFDLAGRPVNRSVEAPPTVGGTTFQSFEHDGRSRLTRTTDNNALFDPSDDSNVSFLYDSLGRLFEEGQSAAAGTPGTGRYTDMAWQAQDLLTALTYPSGNQVTYGYDGAERLRTMNDMLHPELTATFEYFGMSRIHTRLSGNGVRMTLLDDSGTLDTGFDGVGRPIRVRHLDPTNGLLAGFEYRYDRAGNNLSARRLHDSDPLLNSRGNVYAYDSAGRLVSSQEGMLDANHNIVSPLFDQQSFRLDGPGNWTSLSRNGTLYLNTPNNLNEYDDMQCCNTHVDDGLRDDFLDPAATPFPDGLNLTYDKNGNQTDTVRQSLRYNFANLPEAAFDLSRGTPVAAYTYDGLGRRAKRQVTGGEGSQGTEGFAYAGHLFPDAIEESDAAGGFAGLGAVGPGGGCLWHVHADGSTQYLLEDALGSTVALVPGMSAGGSLQVIERVVYSPHGKPTFQSAGNVPIVNPGSGTFIAESQFGNPHLFLGMHYDPELGARGTSVNNDFGGLYATAGFYNPNEGRPMRGGSPGPSSSYSSNYSENYSFNYSSNYSGNYTGNYGGNVGFNTGFNDGPGGEEIYTDKYGRVKVQFHWDRRGKKDEASARIPVHTPEWTNFSGGAAEYGDILPFVSVLDPLEFSFAAGGLANAIGMKFGSNGPPCPPNCSKATSGSSKGLQMDLWTQPGPIQSPAWSWTQPGPSQSPAWAWVQPGPSQ